VAISFVLDSLLRHGSVETDAARIPARLPAFAHSFDEFIREQILNILCSDMAFARLCPIDATDTQHGNGTFFETSLAEHVLCTHVNLP
jgi:hypothetical protein